ncbi:MAG TPA: CHASE domain-containing protein [Telluria sp.]|jgi:signal transduction histidine kinase
MRVSLYYRRVWSPILALSMGLLSSFIVFFYSLEQELAFQKRDFALCTSHYLREVGKGMEGALQASILLNQSFDTFGNMSAQQFSAYAAPLKQWFPYITGLGYHRLVKHANCPQLERGAQSALPKNTISTQSPAGRAVAPTGEPGALIDDAVAPWTIGMAAWSRPENDETAQRAIAQGRPAASTIFPLPEDNGRTRGFRLVSPHFSARTPQSQEPRKRELLGLTVMAIRADALFASISSSLAPAGAHTVDLSVYGNDWPDPDALLYQTPGAQEAAPRANGSCRIFCGPASSARTVDWAGRRWHVVISERPQPFSNAHQGSLTLLLIGLLFSIAVTLYIQQQQRLASRMRDLVVRRTTELCSLNTILIGDIEARQKLNDELERSRRQLRELAEHNARVKENERKRIAREIHDDLGQNMLALRIDLAMLSQGDLHQGTRSGIDKALAHIDTMMAAMRMIINELRPAVLDLGLDAAVEWELAKFQRRTGIECHLDIQRDALNPGDEISAALYRIVQESMTNIMRHARATRVELALWSENGWILLRLSDNGVGMTEQCRRKTTSFGLIGIAERIHALGGTFDTDSSTGNGTTLTIAVPVAPDVALALAAA